jgi:uncharacterized protein (DUF2252 family)
VSGSSAEAEARALAGRHPHFTVEERIARGRLARKDAPRRSHAAWTPEPDRPDPVALIAEQAESRIPELVPIRHARMLVSPFAFYRGAALIMAADLAPTARSGVNVQLCGDAHLSNFGIFGSPERRLIFDINDFDETLPGPWEWDLKRLAASLEILGRERGFAPADRRGLVESCVREYRDLMRRAADLRTLEVWYDHMSMDGVLDLLRVDAEQAGVDARDVKEAERDVAKARTRDHARVLAKRADRVDGELRIVADPPLIVPVEDLLPPGTSRDEVEEWMRSLIDVYRRSILVHHHPFEEFEYVHTARKVVGVGSVGTGAWVHLFVGRDEGDPLFLQSKEAQPSVLERFLGASALENRGRRVVVGQRLMQAASDIFLGWLTVVGIDGRPKDYYVRQFHDWKGGIEVENLHLHGAEFYGRLCGATLARAHARWGDRIAIASYLGKGDVFDRALADFAVAYADQNERDYEAFAAAVASGRLEAQTGL